MEAKERIIVALDVDTISDALELVETLSGHVGLFKIGLQLITANGPDIFHQIRKRFPETQFFYDAKFSDIPNTVGQAVKNAAALPGVRFISVHASAGSDALKAAVEAQGTATILGITALTSLAGLDVKHIFGATLEPPRGQVVDRFARDLSICRVGGAVCSPAEISLVKAQHLIAVVPGIRPTWAVANDQKSIDTPGQAIKNGADFLVIGRPITSPPTRMGGPRDAVSAIVNEINETLAPK